MNFIGVLAMIAGLGFAVSAVQFVRMGVCLFLYGFGSTD
jgi:cation-transporting ATPase 13A2